MAKTEFWTAIHTERKALMADLDGIGEDSWSKPSLCSEWTVRDVVAHMTATAKITAPTFFPKLAASGFSLTRMQSKDIARESGASSADTLSRFESVLTSVKHPPGPLDTMIGETIIHAEDVRRPLGIHREYPSDAVIRVLDFYKGSNLILGAKRRIAGLTLRATDADWSHGSGPEVSGPVVALVLAMTGRTSALDELTGDGVTTLGNRS